MKDLRGQARVTAFLRNSLAEGAQDVLTLEAMASPRVGVFELAEIGEELQYVGGVHGFETLQEQAAKQAREHADRKQEAVPTGDPALAVRR